MLARLAAAATALPFVSHAPKLSGAWLTNGSMVEFCGGGSGGGSGSGFAEVGPAAVDASESTVLALHSGRAIRSPPVGAEVDHACRVQ